jgi:hypothetical protein
MALGFPTNPLVGSTYILGTQTYVWNGVAWAIQTQAAQNPESITVGTGTFTISISSGTITIDNYQVVTTNTLGNIAVTALNAGTDTRVSSTTGNVIIWNESTLESVTSRGATSTHDISLSSTSTSTSTDSGALTVVGGVGIGGDLNVGGNVFFANTENAVSTSSASVVFAGGVGIAGDLYLGGDFYARGQTVLTTSSFVGQIVAGTDILVTATDTGVIYFSNVSTLQSVTDRGNVTTNRIVVENTTTASSSSTGAVVIAGGLGVGGRIYSESVQIADAIFDSMVVNINNTATVVVDYYPFSTFRSAKYVIQIHSGSGPTAQFEVIEILLLADNIGTIYATEYAVLSSAGELGVFAAALDVPTNNINLYFTPYAATNKELTILRTGLTV